jgi:pSer/pThr/pTyr-binding forkhead associated (FHA) protein
MAVTVVVRSGASPRGEGEGPLSITLDAPMVVIGRGEGCDIRLPDPTVSHRHATIRQRGSEHILVDEGSTNGTFMGGVRLGSQAPRILRHGDLARVGRVWLEIRFDRPVPAAEAAMATKELALALVARALETSGEYGGPRVVVATGPDAGKALALTEPSRAYLVGRGQDADLVLTDADASRRHVQLVRRADQVLARDAGSKNGASLEGEMLSRDRDRIIRPGDQLQIGQNLLSYEHPAIGALRELEQAGDERMREGEAVAGPERDPGAPAPAAPEGAAPIAELPADRARSQRKSTPSGWTSTDLMVVLLAVGVLGLSILGLFWLFRG